MQYIIHISPKQSWSYNDFLNHIKIMVYLNVDAYNFIMLTTVDFSQYLASNFSLALMIYGLTTLYKLLVAIWTTMK